MGLVMITRCCGEPSQLAGLGAFRRVRDALSVEYSLLQAAEAVNSLFRAIRMCICQTLRLPTVYRPVKRALSWFLSFWCRAD
jgi:hypothetical protein